MTDFDDRASDSDDGRLDGGKAVDDDEDCGEGHDDWQVDQGERQPEQSEPLEGPDGVGDDCVGCTRPGCRTSLGQQRVDEVDR